MIAGACIRHESVIDPATAAEQMALRLLAARDHSRTELARKLSARGIADDVAAEALDRLERAGGIDPRRLVEHYVEERAGKGFGPLRIRGELRRKGVSDEVIDLKFGTMMDEWDACLTDVHNRRFGSEPPADRDELARRARFLEQRGFPADSIRRLLRWID